MEDKLISDRTIIRIAQVISAVFSPFTIPFFAFLILFLFSYLRIMPLSYKLIVLGIVYCFTILVPTVAIYLYGKILGIETNDLNRREHRFVPFILTLLSYVCCFILMKRYNIPWYMSGIIFTALLLTVVCVISNLWWKLSEHMAGAGAIIGGLIAFSLLFGYNPVWWLCLFIFISGLLGSARIILTRHNLGEVMGGFAVGLICSLLVLYPTRNMLFQLLLF